MSLGNILIVEDDSKTMNLISQILSAEGYNVRGSGTLFQAQGEVQRFFPDCIVLDRRLPDGDGLDFCRHLRSDDKTRSIPILFLTAKRSTSDKVVGLKIGGDDYLTKPFQSEELLARIEVLLRRSKGHEEPLHKMLEVHGIAMNLANHQCKVGSKIIRLWPKEFELLQLFMERPGRLFSKEFLSQRIWQHDFFSNSRAIEITVQRLRRKLGPKGSLIETVKGYGYRMDEE